MRDSGVKVSFSFPCLNNFPSLSVLPQFAPVRLDSFIFSVSDTEQGHGASPSRDQKFQPVLSGI